MSYAELFCQSNFSFLQGASHPEELVLQANKLGYDAIAITDECSVAGVVRAFDVIKNQQLAIKLIVGAYFKYQNFSFVLLAPNRQAYAEICRVITNARRRCSKGQYEIQRWDIHSLQQCLIIWLPSGATEDDDQIVSWLVKYHHARLYLGYQRLLTHNEQQYIQYCEALAEQFDLTIVACGAVLMHVPERQPLQDVLSSILQGRLLSEMGTKLEQNAERCLRPLAKIEKLFPEAFILAGLRLANLCTFELGSLQYEYPAELVPHGKTAITYLKELVKNGIALRFKEGVQNDIEYIINKELRLIEEQKYEFFFLTIYDIVQFAKSQGILYQGRGSAANSIVCYCLEITSVDPRQISVLFERFISKERNEPPDIDVDFEHHRREEVIQYIYQKYGRERAALAATVITYRLKSAIREVGKVLGFNETQLDYFIKNMNRRDKQQCWREQIADLGLKQHSRQGKIFIQLVEEIIGFPRHLSQHVGGFVISSGPLYELVPIENAAMAERTVIQWDKEDLETLGLLKVDILALGMLSAIRRAFSYIEQHYQQSLSIAQITALPEDPQVYRMLQGADTVGVFQIESRAQMSMLPRLKPQCYYDLVIQIAIVRPGPIQGDMVHPYLRRRDGLEPIEYPSKAVESVLSRTLGVPIFQEQVIQLAMVAAGFSGGEADQLRRAMAKWKRNGELTRFREKLITGMRKRGYQQAFAERIFEQICGFGEYGFPESHSASFAVLAYVSAWLKYYYPTAFYTALLNSYPMGFYSPSQLVQDAKRHQLVVKPIDINLSCYAHQVIYDKHSNDFVLQLGFSSIKGLSKQAVDILLTHRNIQPEQQFKRLEEVIASEIPESALTLLASANAFSSMSGDRYQTRWQLLDQNRRLPLWKDVPTDVAEPQQAFDFTPSTLDDVTEDYAVTGLSLTAHPVELLLQQMTKRKYVLAKDLVTIAHQTIVTIIGLVTGKQSPGTASGVTFVTLEDHTGNTNVIVWQATARAQKQAFLTAKILQVTGILEREGQVVHVVAGKLVDLTEKLASLQTQSRDFH